MPEIVSRRFMQVRDAEGCLRNLGVGITDNGQVALIGTGGGIGLLSPAEVPAYQRLVREALSDAAGQW